MADVKRRRPLPALICLLALTLLTALVWWRVLHRGTDHANAKSSCTPRNAQSFLPRPASIRISVLNSTQRPGIAKSTAANLSKHGFKVSGYANDTVHISGVAEIRFGSDQRNAATLLSYYFPGAKLVPHSATSDSTVVVSLGAKFKSIATSAAVKAAMASAHVRLSPAGTPTPTSSASC